MEESLGSVVFVAKQHEIYIGGKWSVNYREMLKNEPFKINEIKDVLSKSEWKFI